MLCNHKFLIGGCLTCADKNRSARRHTANNEAANGRALVSLTFYLPTSRYVVPRSVLIQFGMSTYTCKHSCKPYTDVSVW